MTKKQTGIECAIEAAGGMRALSRQLGVSLQSVQNYKRRGWCSIQRAIEIEAQYGIPRTELVSPKDLANAEALSDPFNGSEQ